MSDYLATWEAAAPGWERERDAVWAATHVIGERMVDTLDPRPGQAILELAAGPGDTGFTAARRIRPGGRLLSTDLSPRMVEAARRRAAELGIDNADFSTIDAQAMDLPDASVDGVLCRFGYMLMPEPATALAETRRVLRAGGKLVFSVWAEAEANPWASVIGRTMVELDVVPPPQPGEPGIFALAQPERIRELARNAGFAEPEIERVEMTWAYGSFAEWWRFTLELAGALAAVIGQLTLEEQERVRATAERNATAFGPEYVVPGVCLNVATS
ncbi:MAG: methyltransferase domain-containing protein [Gaiellaceae bacterium MAG52_C11]|nr:methyltransferase domain-containing protein [Candidatus Gaiellasilicea maunaloa]